MKKSILWTSAAIFILIGLCVLIGCGGGSLTKTTEGFTWKSNQRTFIKYEKGEEKLEIDNRGKPLLNIGAGAISPKIIP